MGVAAARNRVARRQPAAGQGRLRLLVAIPARPVWNHQIRGPVRFWSLDGPDESVLRALAERRHTDLPRITADQTELREQTAAELASALARLRAAHGSYWERDWRREHRGNGRYPEHHLWDTVHGYLDLLDAHRNQDTTA